MKLYYNPLDKACKSVVGAIGQGERLSLWVYEFMDGSPCPFEGTAELILTRDGGATVTLPMEKEGDHYALGLEFPSTGLYFYYFKFDGRIFSRGRLQEGEFSKEARPWQLTVCKKGYRTPEWLKGGVIYQIFPDRFCQGDGPIPLKNSTRRMRRWGEQPEFRPNEAGEVLNHDFFGGNLKGIDEKLSYLHALGVTAIYLNPIFEAFSNHRYDTGDFFKIDELLGTVGDFRSLAQNAEKMGIKLILDGVFNHVGADSVYFNRYGKYPCLGAFQSENSPYFSWFRFHRFPEDYDCWWGIKTLPAVNENEPSYREFLFGENGVLRYWLRYGIGGFRLDVVDELPDDFLKEMRETVKHAAPEAVLLGEVWEDASDKISYGERKKYLQGEELDGVMNYPLKDAIIEFAARGNCEKLRETVFSLVDHYPKDALDLAMNILSTHDTPRILSVLGGISWDKEKAAQTKLTGFAKKNAEDKLKMAALLQFTLPGVPCIFYGDETGMEGGPDPLCRGCFPWNDLRQDLIGFYKRLGALRAKFRDVFGKGSYREIYAKGGMFFFERKLDDKSVYIYVNNSPEKYYAELFEPLWDELAGKAFGQSLSVAPYSYGIFSNYEP